MGEGTLTVVFLCALVSVAHSQCPQTPSPQENSSDSNSTGNNACNMFKGVYRPVRRMYREQPLFVVLYADAPDYNRIDNVCYTLFPLPDGDCDTYRIYASRVYVDGSTEIRSFIIKTVETGGNYWSSATFSYINNNLGDIGCGAYLRQACGLNAYHFPPFFTAFGPAPSGGPKQLTQECLQNARNLAKENGLDLGDVYLPPYKLPTNCVYHQICLPENNPLSYQQANTCKASNYSSCFELFNCNTEYCKRYFRSRI